MRRFLAISALAALAGGCYVPPGAPTPVQYRTRIEPTTGEQYYIYVPSYYSADRDWPMVVTLHGTIPWDTANMQIREWDSLAEEKGFIVIAPFLKSPQGILPKIRFRWFKDLADDEATVLAVMDHVGAEYNVDRGSVMLSGFSAGGYPMYYIGLRNPGQFNMLVARACNSDAELFEKIQLTEQAKKMPIRIFWGRDDLGPIHSQSWAAFRFLRVHGCYETQRKMIKGGHLRHPDLAYEFWLSALPDRHRR